MTTIKTQNVTWIDIKEPSPKELKYLAENYGLHPLILDGLKEPTVRSSAEEHNGYLYVVMHFPVYNSARKVSQPVEIDFIITPDTLISVHYENINPLEEFLTKCRPANSSARKHSMGKSSVYLFYYLVKELYAFSLRQLDHIDEKIGEIEEVIFNNQEREMLVALSLIRSDIINFLRALRPQSAVLNSLVVRAEFFETKARPYLTDLIGEHERVMNQAESHREIIEGLQSTNESLLNSKTNEIMKVLTIITFVALPLSLLANIFGMSSGNIPLVDQPNFFWIMIITMIATAGAFLLIFRHKKWL